MQRQAQRAFGIVGLVVSILLLLNGCVAPDGTVFRLQQASDGAIVGLQIDAPIEATTGATAEVTATMATAATPIAYATPFLQRPILYVGSVEVWNIKAVESDGTAVGNAGSGALLGWSRQGARFAYLTLGGEDVFSGLVVSALGEEGQTIYRPGTGSLITNYVRQSVWSPDGTKIALVLFNREVGLQIILIDVDSGQIVNEFTLSEEISLMYTDLAMNLNAQVASVNWSPDGQKLLLSLGDLVVFDLQSGVAETIVSDMSAPGLAEQAEWLPSSDGIIFLDGYVHDGKSLAPPQLWRQMLGEAEPELLLSTEQLVTLGLAGSDQFAIMLSPTGRYLALLGINNGVDEGTAFSSTLLALDLAALQSRSVDQWAMQQPAAAWTLPAMVFFVEWSPDEQQFAFAMLSEQQGSTIEVLSWSEATSQTIATINVNDGSTIFLGINVVSWMP